MQIDPQYLSQHYKRLPDEVFLAIDRCDLGQSAQKYYDART
jgi:hypothetical protein